MNTFCETFLLILKLILEVVDPLGYLLFHFFILPFKLDNSAFFCFKRRG